MFNPEGKDPYSRYGIQCGKGWAQLYEPLIAEAERQGATILQIKEKFGGLRFYYGGGSDPQKLDNMVRAAEIASFKTCETCGAEGKRHDDGWLITLCDKCYADYKERRKG